MFLNYVKLFTYLYHLCGHVLFCNINVKLWKYHMVKCKPPTTQLGLIKDISVETLVSVVGRIRHTPTQTLSLVLPVAIGLNKL